MDILVGIVIGWGLGFIAGAVMGVRSARADKYRPLPGTPLEYYRR